MMFYLTTVGLLKYLPKDKTVMPDEEETNILVQVHSGSWHQGDHLYKNTLLSYSDRSLHGVYCYMQTDNELWAALEDMCLPVP